MSLNLYEDIELEKINIPENVLNATGTSELEQLREQHPQVYAEMEQMFERDSQCLFVEVVVEKFSNYIPVTHQKKFDISKSKKAANRISDYS